MNIKLMTLLAGVCAGLTLVIAGEWFYASFVQQQLLASVMSVKASGVHPDELPSIELADESESGYDDLVSRPLFIKGRRPVDEPAPETGAPVVEQNFDWQLTGVYTTPKGLSAMFNRAKTNVAKDSHRRIVTGEELDGWKLTEINKDKVVLTQGSEQKELPLRKPKPKTLPLKPAVKLPNQPVPRAVPATEPPPEQTEVDTTETPQ